MSEPTREMTIEELEAQYDEMNEQRKRLAAKIKMKKREEEERKVAQLALDKEKRKEEVDKACEKFLELRKAYMRDYGSYNYTTDDGYTSLFDIFRLW
jgi:hypothetical protein